MLDYLIYVDSACDIPESTLAEWGLRSIQLTVDFADKNEVYKNNEIDEAVFYKRMRDGEVAKTSAVNQEEFREVFEKEAKNGNDILYLAFSSGLSSTFETGARVAQEVMEDYPERRIIVIDSLSASAGYGLLAYLMAQKAEAGASMEEIRSYVQERIPHMAHWFTVDDLQYLKRGGRISPAAAFVAGALKIKPVLHVDDEGHLISMSKVRGRKASIDALAWHYAQTAEHPTKGPVFISHGDCKDDADYLAEVLQKEHGVGIDQLVYVGPVIGAHSGPGTLALFFEASHK